MNSRSRLFWLLIPLSFAGVLLTAALLHPNPTGIGTHRALGLPDCLFHYLTGRICPSCGLTTSFTYLVHLHGLKAFQAHPLGPVIFLLYALLSFLALLEFGGRLTLLSDFFKGKNSGWIYGGLILYIGTWISRLIWGLPHNS